MAGTIGGLGGNGSGVAGVNWYVTLISGKFLGPNGGTTANAVKAIDYFTDLKTRHGLNIVATNNSWGSGGYSQALHDAIIRAAKAGILFVAAAGNGNIFRPTVEQRRVRALSVQLRHDGWHVHGDGGQLRRGDRRHFAHKQWSQV